MGTGGDATLAGDTQLLTPNLRARKNVMSSFIFEYSDAGHAVQHVKAADLAVKLYHFIKTIPHVKKEVTA